MGDIDVIVPWTPISLPEDYYNVEALHDDYEGLRILLRGEKLESKMLRVKFDSPYSYKSTQESYHYGFGNVGKNDRQTFFKENRLFFIVNKSSYIDHLHACSGDAYKDSNIIHYAIYASNDCVDVLSIEEPVVEWLN